MEEQPGQELQGVQVEQVVQQQPQVVQAVPAVEAVQAVQAARNDRPVEGYPAEVNARKVYNCVLIGKIGVGKTTLHSCLCRTNYNLPNKTLGVATSENIIHTFDPPGRQFSVSCIDTRGFEGDEKDTQILQAMKSQLSQFFARVDKIFWCFTVTRMAPNDRAVINFIRDNAPKEFHDAIHLVITHCHRNDIPRIQREVYVEFQWLDAVATRVTFCDLNDLRNVPAGGYEEELQNWNRTREELLNVIEGRPQAEEQRVPKSFVHVDQFTAISDNIMREQMRKKEKESRNLHLTLIIICAVASGWLLQYYYRHISSTSC